MLQKTPYHLIGKSNLRAPSDPLTDDEITARDWQNHVAKGRIGEKANKTATQSTPEPDE
jgi:hypothetical protein